MKLVFIALITLIPLIVTMCVWQRDSYEQRLLTNYPDILFIVDENVGSPDQHFVLYVDRAGRYCVASKRLDDKLKLIGCTVSRASGGSS